MYEIYRKGCTDVLFDPHKSGWKYLYDSHLKDAETEEQSFSGCPDSHAFEREIPDLNSGLFPHRRLPLICNIITSSAASKVELICFPCHLGKLRLRKVPQATPQVRRLGLGSSFLTSMRLISFHHSCSDILQDTLAQTEQRSRQLCLHECMYTHSHTHTYTLTHRKEHATPNIQKKENYQ